MRPLAQFISLMNSSYFCTNAHTIEISLFYYNRVRNSAYLLSRIVPMWRHVIVAKMGVMKG